VYVVSDLRHWSMLPDYVGKVRKNFVERFAVAPRRAQIKYTFFLNFFKSGFYNLHFYQSFLPLFLSDFLLIYMGNIVSLISLNKSIFFSSFIVLRYQLKKKHSWK
jgi:hypothetical protein